MAGHGEFNAIVVDLRRASRQVSDNATFEEVIENAPGNFYMRAFCFGACRKLPTTALQK